MNILIIDRQRLFAEGLRSLLNIQEGIENVYLYHEENEERYMPSTDNIDLVICDPSFPEGLDIINKVEKKIMKPGVLVLSDISDASVVRQTLKMGVLAFISKDVSQEELMEGIAEAYAGRKFISKKLRTYFFNSLINDKEETVSEISLKEREVLMALCEGSTVREISEKMGLRIHTINYYQRSLMKKINVDRTFDLIMFAIKKGIYVYEKSF